MITEHFYDNRENLFEALTTDCVGLLQQAVELRGQASFLVSGGSTPKPLYQRLAKSPLPWQQITVALVDERWVEPGHSGSNETFIRENLLRDAAAIAAYVATKNSYASAISGLSDCENAYRTLPRPFDLTLLGMGPDGHTASLFPHAEGLITALDSNSEHLCAAIHAQRSEVTGDLTERMSLSLYGLLQSRQLHLLITGEDKLNVYKAATINADVAATPVSAVLRQQQVPVHVYWAP